MTAGGREFQVAGAAQLKDRLPISVRLKGTSRNGTTDDRSDRVPLRALMDLQPGNSICVQTPVICVNRHYRVQGQSMVCVHT